MYSENEHITIYQPNLRRTQGLFFTYKTIFKNILNYRELIFQLFKRDFFSSYKKSFLGLTWLFISPIVGILAWIITFKAGILNPGESKIPYSSFVLMGTFFWSLFLGTYNSSMSTLTAGAGFIHQVKYPHEILFAKQMLQQLTSSSITFFINFVILLIFGIIPSWKIIFFPLLCIPIMLLSASIGLIVSVIGVVLTEIQKILDIAWGLLFWITPVVFTLSNSKPIFSKLIHLNPLTYLIDEARNLIFLGYFEHFNEYILCAAISAFLFLISLRLFYISEEKVIEKLL